MTTILLVASGHLLLVECHTPGTRVERHRGIADRNLADMTLRFLESTTPRLVEA
jgi:hypothetical protein